MAAGIGADVPFFLKGGAAYGTGIGEILEQILYVKFLFSLVINNAKWAEVLN